MEITSRRQRLRRAGSTLLHCAVAGLAAATLLAEFGDRWWIADFFAHFRFQYMAVALAAAAAALLMRLRRLAAVACLLIIPQVIVIAGVPIADRAGDAAPSARIRVVTANIQWRNSSFETLTSHFRDAQADVIALEELTPAALPLIQALQKDYPHIAPADWRGEAVRRRLAQPASDRECPVPARDLGADRRSDCPPPRRPVSLHCASRPLPDELVAL